MMVFSFFLAVLLFVSSILVVVALQPPQRTPASTRRKQQQQQSSSSSSFVLQRVLQSTTTTSESSSTSSSHSQQPLVVVSTVAQNNDNNQNSPLLTNNKEQERFSDRYGHDNVLPSWLLDRCEEIGYIYPTRIQKYTLDTLLLLSSSSESEEEQDKKNNHNNENHNTDYIIQSETGSGKTLAYLLPILGNIDSSKKNSIQAMIVVPTRELGLQVSKVAKRLAYGAVASSGHNSSNDDDIITDKKKNKIMIMSVLQGSQNRRQRAWAWSEPPHVVIGTPKELCDMIRYAGLKRVNNKNLKYLVVDEIDACLEGTSTHLHELLSKYLSPTYFNDDGKGSDAEASALLDGPILGGGGGGTKLQNKNKQQQQQSTTRQTIFCSATIPQIRHFIKKCKQNQWMSNSPIHICPTSSNSKSQLLSQLASSTGAGGVSSSLLPSQLRHGYFVCKDDSQKFRILRQLVAKIIRQHHSSPQHAKILLFADPHRPLEEMATILASDTNDGIYWTEQQQAKTTASNNTQQQKQSSLISVLRYEDSLSQRATAMNIMMDMDDDDNGSSRGNSSTSSSDRDDNDDDKSNGIDSDDTDHNGRSSSFRMLLATDLAGRGLDIPDITHVIQFDLPTTANMYLHRSGRTGRMGKSGHVISIISENQEFVLQRIANELLLTDTMSCIGRSSSASGTKKKKK